MSKRTLVYVLGDVHGDMGRLNTFIDRKIRQHPIVKTLAEDGARGGDEFRVVILQCGDMAYFWPFVDHADMIRNLIDFLPGGRVPIYWCGGNHEDWDQLDGLFSPASLADRTNMAEVEKGIFFCRFGATLELVPDITVLFVGGAESIDKDYRLRKMRSKGCPKIWWEQEGIGEADMERLKNIPRADLIISHTAPKAFSLAPSLAGNAWDGKHIDEPSRELLMMSCENTDRKNGFSDISTNT